MRKKIIFVFFCTLFLAVAGSACNQAIEEIPSKISEESGWKLIVKKDSDQRNEVKSDSEVGNIDEKKELKETGNSKKDKELKEAGNSDSEKGLKEAGSNNTENLLKTAGNIDEEKELKEAGNDNEKSLLREAEESGKDRKNAGSENAVKEESGKRKGSRENASGKERVENTETLIPGVNAPELSQSTKETESIGKISKEAEKAVAEILEKVSQSEINDTKETKDSGVFYVGENGMKVYTGPGEEYTSVLDHGEIAILNSNCPVNLTGRTENGWLHINYVSTGGMAYEKGEPLIIEGYIKDVSLIKEADYLASLETLANRNEIVKNEVEELIENKAKERKETKEEISGKDTEIKEKEINEKEKKVSVEGEEKEDSPAEEEVSEERTTEEDISERKGE